MRLDQIHPALRGNVKLSVSGIVFSNERFLFSVQPPSRWRRNQAGVPMIAFGGIGGKVEPGEDLYDALAREFQEELRLSIDAISDAGPFAVLDRETVRMDPVGISWLAPRPLFLQVVEDRSIPQSSTAIFSYACVTTSRVVRPNDNPAAIGLDLTLIRQIFSTEVTLANALAQGAVLYGGAELPRQYVLSGTPTPRALIRYWDRLGKTQRQNLLKKLAASPALV